MSRKIIIPTAGKKPLREMPHLKYLTKEDFGVYRPRYANRYKL
jgi:hypothetical protein